MVPRARRTELVGVLGDAVKIRLLAPPIDGAANEALVDFVATSLGVRASDIAIVAGEKSRTKSLEVQGRTPAEVAAWLATARP